VCAGIVRIACRAGAPEKGKKTLDHIIQPRVWNRWLRLAVYISCGLAFLADLSNDATLAFGVFYLPLVSTAVYHRDPRMPWLLASLASAMVVIGFFLPSIPADFSTGLANRGLSIAAIFITAYLIHHERQIRDRLAEQTARAEAADRVKTQLFDNLSHELRTPLSAILGFADLLISDARPDQLMALGYIQSGGRRLRATLDNLIDLTQIDARELRIRNLDLTAMMRQAVEMSRPLATEKRIALTMVMPDAKPLAVRADSWALRRIIDNLLANAIKFTDPGGSVEVSVRRMPDRIVTTVTDTGAGMPPRVLEQIGEPFFQADSGAAKRFEGMGTGLALSIRLAEAMGVTLHFDSTLGSGTAVSLTLPLAAPSRSNIVDPTPRDNSAA
jgi:signal transduction histidine kinase